MLRNFLLLAALLMVALSVTAADDQEVPYPEGYRHWTFLHSSLVSPTTFARFAKKSCDAPCGGGLFHFYGNDKAMEGLRSGSYSDGAIFAEEMLEWIPNSNGSGKEGARQLIGVMVRDSQRYNATGGWGYGMFTDAKTNMLDAKERTACYTCHIPRKDHGYVITEYRER